MFHHKQVSGGLRGPRGYSQYRVASSPYWTRRMKDKYALEQALSKYDTAETALDVIADIYHRPWLLQEYRWRQGRKTNRFYHEGMGHRRLDRSHGRSTSTYSGPYSGRRR